MVERWTISVVISLRLRSAQQKVTFMFWLPKVLLVRRPICSRESFFIIGRIFWRPWWVSAAFSWTLRCTQGSHKLVCGAWKALALWIGGTCRFVRGVGRGGSWVLPQALHSLSNHVSFQEPGVRRGYVIIEDLEIPYFLVSEWWSCKLTVALEISKWLYH